MIKEELKQEAKKDVESLNGIDLVSSTMIAIDKYGAYKLGRYDGYLAGAEPREKQIQIDAEQIRALQKDKGNLTDRVRDLEETNKANEWQYVKDGDLPKENKLYFVAIKDNGLAIAYFNGLHWETRYNLGDFGHCVETVIAWKEITLPRQEE